MESAALEQVCALQELLTMLPQFKESDGPVFSSILTNGQHTPQPFLPDGHKVQYNLRARSHDKFLIDKTTYLNRDFFPILYKSCY